MPNRRGACAPGRPAKCVTEDTTERFSELRQEWPTEEEAQLSSRLGISPNSKTGREMLETLKALSGSGEGKRIRGCVFCGEEDITGRALRHVTLFHCNKCGRNWDAPPIPRLGQVAPTARISPTESSLDSANRYRNPFRNVPTRGGR